MRDAAILHTCHDEWVSGRARVWQGEDDDALSISSRLRDVMIGSEDEMESVLSAPLSPAASADHNHNHRSSSPSAVFRHPGGT